MNKKSIIIKLDSGNTMSVMPFDGIAEGLEPWIMVYSNHCGQNDFIGVPTFGIPLRSKDAAALRDALTSALETVMRKNEGVAS